MSAITGIYHVNSGFVSREQGEQMMDELKKFPADSIRTWNQANIFLGCHAQWITPESIGEQLPRYNPEWQLAITADAIIDNREELCHLLNLGDVKRKTISDSEMILLAYQKWGTDAPKYLVGDFVFVIWDEKNNKLFCARDFSGTRTFYYSYNPKTGQFAFSSLMGPLLSLPFVKNKLNEEWLAEFLAIPVNFESVEPGATVYDQLLQLPPSHTLTIEQGRLRLSRYCTLGSKAMLKLKNPEEYEEAFHDVFQTAVKSRLRTHHQVGSHLSGGLDSGSVVSFAATALRHENKKLHTFSYVPLKVFHDFTHKSRIPNESEQIHAVVDYVGNIESNLLSFAERSPYSEIDDWLDTLEMPYKFFENTFWLKGFYEVAQSKGIGVLLNGQRGNWTISWGPVQDYYAVLLKRLRLLHLFKELSLYSKNIGVAKSRILSRVYRKAFPGIFRHLEAANQTPFPAIINKEFAKRTDVFAKLEGHGIDTTATLMPSAYEVRERQFKQLYYWGTTGTYGSKLSLRYSVMDRDPTNDLRVLRFCLSVPEDQYVRDGLDRSLIRRVTKNLLPDEIRLNLKTRGVQGADGVQRMAPSWKVFIAELELMCADPISGEYLDLNVIKEAILLIKAEPRPEYIFDFHFRILMRSLIVYRFIKRRC